MTLKKETGIDKTMVREMADELVDEMATKMYYKLKMLRFLPEIKSIERGESKGLRGSEIHKFLSKTE